jgi:hypothetical protein
MTTSANRISNTIIFSHIPPSHSLPPKTKINKNDKLCIFVVVLARAKTMNLGLRNRTKE